MLACNVVWFCYFVSTYITYRLGLPSWYTRLFTRPLYGWQFPVTPRILVKRLWSNVCPSYSTLRMLYIGKPWKIVLVSWEELSCRAGLTWLPAKFSSVSERRAWSDYVTMMLKDIYMNNLSSIASNAAIELWRVNTRVWTNSLLSSYARYVGHSR